MTKHFVFGSCAAKLIDFVGKEIAKLLWNKRERRKSS